MNPKPSLNGRALLAAATLALATGASLQAQSTNNSLARVSPALAQAHDLGAVAPAQPLRLTVRLAGNKAALDKAVAALYDPASPSFHKWMTDADLKQYAPSDAQVAAVRQQLESRGLAVAPGADDFSLRVTGNAAAVASAFHTQLHQFQSAGAVFQANTTPASLGGAAEGLVSSVAGLESHPVQPMFKRAINLGTGQPYPGIPLAKVEALPGKLSDVQTDIALTGPTDFYLTTPGASLPVALYYGNQYGVDPNLAVSFTPAQLQSVLGLTAAYSQGLDGTGQTIVLLEAYGDTYIESDANAFNKLAGLPLLDSSNFSVVYPEGVPKNQDRVAALVGWPTEIDLDVQWAHAIAPGAKIVVVAAAGQDSQDFQDAMSYIVKNGTGFAVSDSWEESTDLIDGPVEQQAFEDVLELAAAKGISFQFSTGDAGDSGLGSPLGAAGVPSDAPHATAVGGIAILNNINGSGFLPVGWGDAVSIIDYNGVQDPPMFGGTLGGAGGGESQYFAKPSWQAALPGTGRQTPDVSALADPYTGVPIVVSINGVQQVLTSVGGTSLAAPIFTAFWALAQQKAGGPLGQAAPLVASLPSGAIQDVLPLMSPTSPVGGILDAKGFQTYTPFQIFSGGTGTEAGFTSAVWNLSGLSTTGVPLYYDLGFGLDGSLTVTSGWDNVTGYGTPYGLPFLNAVAKAAGK